MERTKDPFDCVRITLTDVARAVGDIVGGVIRHLPESGYPSDRPRGANAMLEGGLGYNQQTFSFDSEGCYFDKLGE